jgi:hypothetical protein
MSRNPYEFEDGSQVYEDTQVLGGGEIGWPANELGSQSVDSGGQVVPANQDGQVGPGSSSGGGIPATTVADSESDSIQFDEDKVNIAENLQKVNTCIAGWKAKITVGRYTQTLLADIDQLALDCTLVLSVAEGAEQAGLGKQYEKVMTTFGTLSDLIKSMDFDRPSKVIKRHPSDTDTAPFSDTQPEQSLEPA